MSNPEMKVVLSAEAGALHEALNKAASELKKFGGEAESAGKSHGSLTGSIQSSISEYAAGAAAGLTLANAIEKIGEFAKESVKWVYESAGAVNELAEKFKELRVTTGENLDSLNELYAASTLSGQGTELLESLMGGWTKGIKSNSENLIANGVAANKAALDGMTFKEYLLKVYEISREMKTPAETNVFLTEALGRGGAQAAPKLKELAENLEQNNNALSTGNLITQTCIDLQERDEQATGALKLAYEKTYASMGDSMNSVLIPFKELVGWFGKTKVAQDDVKAALDAGIITTEHWYETLGTVEARLADTLARFKALAAEATKAARDSWDVGTGDAATKNRSLVSAGSNDAAKSAKEKAEKAAKSARDAAERARLDAIQLEVRLAKEQEDIEAGIAKFNEETRKEGLRKWAEMLKEKDRLDKEAAAAEKKLTEEIRAAWEQNTLQGGIFVYLQEARKALQAWGSFAQSILQGVEMSFAHGIQGMLTGSMRLGAGLKSIWKGIGDTVASALAQMAAKWIVATIASKLFSKVSQQGAQEEAIGKQQAAAAGIFNAHAYIPFVGPAIAAGLIAMMNATLLANSVAAKGVVAHAQGGLVTSPTLALIGERGENEVVAPETVFQDWAGNLTRNIMAQERQVQAYQLQGTGYASAARETGSFGGSGYVDLRGAVIAGESAESARIIGKLIRKHGQGNDQRNG